MNACDGNMESTVDEYKPTDIEVALHLLLYFDSPSGYPHALFNMAETALTHTRKFSKWFRGGKQSLQTGFLKQTVSEMLKN